MTLFECRHSSKRQCVQAPSISKSWGIATSTQTACPTFSQGQLRLNCDSSKTPFVGANRLAHRLDPFPGLRQARRYALGWAIGLKQRKALDLDNNHSALQLQCARNDRYGQRNRGIKFFLLSNFRRGIWRAWKAFAESEQKQDASWKTPEEPIGCFHS